MKKFLVSLLAVILVAVPTASQEVSRTTLRDAAAIRDKALSDPLAWEILESLTTEIGPRLAGTPAEHRAAEWGVEKLKALGFDKVWTEPIKIPVWTRVHDRGAIVRPFPQPVLLTALGSSPSSPRGGITAEILHFETYQDLLDAPDGVATGKIVYISNRMERARNGSGYGVAGVARFNGPSTAAKKGALGIIIRSIGTEDHRFPHTGATNWEEEVQKIPAAAISNPDADQLDRILKTGRSIIFNMDLKTIDHGEGISYNVIGEITGSERPDEIIAIGGHLDSWDLGTGAVDDGAGIAITTAAAKLIADQKRPKRTIRVIMFGAEEIGIFGGNQYAEVYKDDLANHIIGSESDFGAGPIYGVTRNVGEQGNVAIDAIIDVLRPLGIARQDGVASGGPDFGPIVRLGMPAIGLSQDGTDYFDLHHTPNDTIAQVNPESLAQNVAAWVVFIRIAADWPGYFTRPPVATETTD